MVFYVIAGVMVLIFVSPCGYYAWRANGRLKALLATETLTAQELGALYAASSKASGPGSFRYRCEVTGVAQHGPAGPVTSELAGVQGVWCALRRSRKYWITERDDEGREHRLDRWQVMSAQASEVPFVVQDATGTVLVHPRDTWPDGADQVVDRFDPMEQPAAGTAIGDTDMRLPPSRPDSGTYGYSTEEYVLTEGQRVFVSGEASDSDGQLVISGPSLITTTGEAELLARERRQRLGFTIGAAVGGTVGVILIVVGLLG